jgi:hypothetical protein
MKRKSGMSHHLFSGALFFTENFRCHADKAKHMPYALRDRLFTLIYWLAWQPFSKNVGISVSYIKISGRDCGFTYVRAMEKAKNRLGKN